MKVKYIRWSSINQKADRQLLNEANFDKIYREQVSGAVAFEKRKEGGRLLADIRDGKITDMAVEEISRCGRNAIDILNTLRICHEAGVNVIVENMGIQSVVDGVPNPIFKLITGILAAMAEMERENIKERTDAGRIAARNRGVRFGRRKGTVEDKAKFMRKPKVREIIKLIEDDRGFTIREIMAMAGASNTLVLKVKNILS